MESHSSLVNTAIKTIQTFAPISQYYGAFSGGKDSIVIKELARLAGIPIVWHYNVTTVDPPELVQYIKREHPDVLFDRPTKPLWARIADQGSPPTRLIRWCCREYKESKAPANSIMLTGVRAAESPRRAEKWKVVNPMVRQDGTHITAIAPILYWSDDEVWQFIRDHQLPYSSLYDEGFKRLGCVLCPMADTQRLKHMKRWPRIARLWKKGIYLAWEKRQRTSMRCDNHYETAEKMWRHWIEVTRYKKKDVVSECQGLGLFI